MTNQDGINGTDSNVEVLFPEKPSAAGLPPQPEIVAMLEQYLLEAASGKISGLLIIGIAETGNHKAVVCGKIPFGYGIAALEQMKFGILARDYTKQLQEQGAS